MSFAKEWRTAVVAEPIGFADEELHTVGAFTITSGAPFILSLSPAEDFELNTDIIHEWKIIFQTSENEILGDADYSQVLAELQPYILDQQSGSILIRALTDDELQDLHAQALFS